MMQRCIFASKKNKGEIVEKPAVLGVFQSNVEKSRHHESVVVRGHPGDIPGFPMEIGTLGYNGHCVLVAGKHCPQCLSLVSDFGLLINLCISYFASTRVADSLEWYSYMLVSS